VNKGIMIDGCEHRQEIDIKGKIFFNKRSGSTRKYELRPLLPYPDNPTVNDPIPPSFISAIPSEHLATTKCPFE